MSVTAKALWYVESHKGGDLSLDAIAGSVGVSRYHLSRAFSIATGCGLAQYIRARRLSEAAKSLRAGAPDILAVALDAGYGSHEAFTRASRQHFGLTPEQVRDQASTSLDRNLLEAKTLQITDSTPVAAPRLAQQDAILIFGLSQSYTCDNKAALPAQWERFVPYIGTLKAQVGRAAYGVICNTDDANHFDYLCGVEVKEFPQLPSDFTRLRIPPQSYAVFVHAGHISTIGATCAAIWNRLLSESGYKPADNPWFEWYGENFDGRTGLGGVEIWIPVQP